MKRILLQAIKFIGLSGIGWILDFTTYTVLGVCFANLFVNNMISSWVGVTFVFIFATRKVFQNNSRISLRWKYLIYLLYQFLLIFLISRLLAYVDTLIIEYIQIALIQRFSYIIAKIVVTPITMILNFLVMKYLIEKL